MRFISELSFFPVFSNIETEVQRKGLQSHSKLVAKLESNFIAFFLHFSSWKLTQTQKVLGALVGRRIKSR